MTMKSWSRVMQLLNLDLANQADQEIENRKSARARKIAGRFTRGNVKLQEQSFLTSAQQKAEKKRLKHTHFAA